MQFFLHCALCNVVLQYEFIVSHLTKPNHKQLTASASSQQSYTAPSPAPVMPAELEPWSLPAEAQITPVPLVGVAGLTDATTWQLLASRGPDRPPLSFTKMDSLDFPVCKPSRTSYEWLLPRGIIKRNWMEKHLSQLPAVLLLAPRSPGGAAALVTEARTALAGRTTKLALLLVGEPPDPATLTAICSECSLPARVVFSLAPASPQAAATLQQLESILHELACNYYHGQIRAVKGHREHLSRTSHLYLLVRHSFKVSLVSCEMG